MIRIYHERPGYEDPKQDGKPHVPMTPRLMKTSIAYVGMLTDRNLPTVSIARYAYSSPFDFKTDLA